MNVTPRVARLSAAVVLVLALLVTGRAAAQELTITPADPSLGVGQTLTFTALSISGVTAIDAGAFHSCARLADGSLRCWGLNDWGQLGDGSFANSAVPVQVVGIAGAASVSGGGYHTCAQFPNGTLSCWGRNESRQLGDPATTADSSTTPVQVGGIGTATSVTAGAFHTCARLTDGTVRCWGQNDAGQLGNGTIINSATPVTPMGLGSVVSVSSGGWHTCALMADGTIRCWGRNDDGQLGNGTTVPSPVPLAVSGVTNAIALKAWIFTTCALLADGTVRCWGRNSDGQLGNGTTTSSSVPTEVVGISGVTLVSPGAEHGCALFGDGTIRCWGDNNFGQLGNGSSALQSTTPAGPVTGIGGASAVISGAVHSCALVPGGEVRCWGQNNWSQLGDGTTNDARTPSSVAAADVTWTSSTPSVASISARGLATALSPGVTTITALSGARAGTTTLTVFARPVLTVVREGLGSGTVTSNPNGIDCGTACSAAFTANTTVTLTATPSLGSTFLGWTGGGCTGTGTCALTLTASTTVSARFGVVGLPGGLQ
jgi:alpha-tubulin suppressor-like RCC1 family protein